MNLCLDNWKNTRSRLSQLSVCGCFEDATGKRDLALESENLSLASTSDQHYLALLEQVT